MDDTDYPAAHSMDADWFAIDDAGEVAWLRTGNDGPVPAEAWSPGFDELLAGLERDSQGVPLLPSALDFFPEGPTTAPLDAALAALTCGERAALARLAAGEALDAGMQRELDRLHAPAIAWEAFIEFVDEADATVLASARWAVRLDASRPIYGVYHLPAAQALRLHLTGRLRAWRTLNAAVDDRFQDDFGVPAILGVYCYSADYSAGDWSAEQAGVDGSGPPLPIRYYRRHVPPMPRRGMPEIALWHGRVPVPALPGARFADASQLQLADHVDCRDWSRQYPPEDDEA